MSTKLSVTFRGVCVNSMCIVLRSACGVPGAPERDAIDAT